MDWLGFPVDGDLAPAKNDHRFRDDAWSQNPVFKFVKQAYLLAARSLYTTVAGVDGLDAKTAAKVEFFTRQTLDALAPTNFLLTNPEVQREFLQTGGLSLLRGLRNLLNDVERGNGNLRISMVDGDAFELGKNIAVTPGKVVFETPMMQLLQYQPSTAKVKKTTAVDRSAVDQQILHTRPSRTELADQMGRRPGPYGVCHLLGEPRRQLRRQRF